MNALPEALLRITIDLPWVAPATDAPAPLLDQFVTVEDCEKVTRQLQFALEVDGVEYKRLEVSSPGIDRPCATNRISCVSRFGHRHHPEGAHGCGSGRSGQRQSQKFRGTLERAESGGWQIVWRDEPAVKPGQKSAKKRVPAPLQALGFTLDELRDARLAPIVDFKGRAGKAGQGRCLSRRLKIQDGRLPHGGQHLQ